MAEKKKKTKKTEEEPEVQVEEPKAEEPQVEEDEYKLPPVTVESVLRSFIEVLGVQCWQWMGLLKNPVTGEMNKDLVQAKIAIDTIGMLANQLEGRINEAERSELQVILSDLRINYVRQSSQG